MLLSRNVLLPRSMWCCQGVCGVAKECVVLPRSVWCCKGVRNVVKEYKLHQISSRYTRMGSCMKNTLAITLELGCQVSSHIK